jgi:hypothetical protein
VTFPTVVGWPVVGPPVPCGTVELNDVVGTPVEGVAVLLSTVVSLPAVVGPAGRVEPSWLVSFPPVNDPLPLLPSCGGDVELVTLTSCMFALRCTVMVHVLPVQGS